LEFHNDSHIAGHAALCFTTIPHDGDQPVMQSEGCHA
jgi:hypothetical protein